MAAAGSLLCTTVILTLVFLHFISASSEPATTSQDASLNHSLSLGPRVNVKITSSNINITFHGTKKSSLTGVLGRAMDTEHMTFCESDSNPNMFGDKVCLHWKNSAKLEVFESNEDMFRSLSDIQCTTINWTIPDHNQTVLETPEDCYSMADSFWFGGFEETNQTWPLNWFQIGSSPFVTGDTYHHHEYGGVIEGLFVSSSGTGIFVYEKSPLYLSINDGSNKLLCLKGKMGADTPFFNYSKPFLTYDVCRSTDLTSLWKGMAERYLPKPSSYPSEDLFRKPIWCTWATYKGKINESSVLSFAESIRKNNFSISQLEIDDDWTPHYGDFDFTAAKFANAKQLIANLTALGASVTVWVHWFFNEDSDAFRELSNAGFFIREYDTNHPALFSWWRGLSAGVLDFTNPAAVKWYLDKLNNLTVNYNVSSFKFDAGEVKWIQTQRFRVYGELLTPNYISKMYTETAFKADMAHRRQEVRVGFRSQSSSNMIRMVDRDSTWGHDLGIKSVIPCALVFGLMGYPYVLPDLIGGNAYDSSDMDVTVLPDPELFIRWLQMSVFLPILQFSVVPWAYNETITKIARDCVQLHEKYADKFIELAKNAQKTGEPIIRPLWWIAPGDIDALTIDTEFLLGDDILVAPVLEQGARSRDVYLPPGHWKDELRNVNIQGGVWLRNYRADITELPYFSQIN